MSQKLEELTQKLYKEGVEKARTEAESIIKDAEVEKEKILKDAAQEADRIIKEAEKETESLKAKTESELRMAARQTENSLKQTIVSLLSEAAVGDALDKALDEKEFIKDLILALLDKGGLAASSSWEALLPEAKKKDFSSFLANSLDKQISSGTVNIKFKERMNAGFVLQATDGSYMLSFTEEDFQNFFRSFVKEKSRALLFGEK